MIVPAAAGRAARLVLAMTLGDKIALLHTRFGTPTNGRPAPPDALMSAGVAPGVPRLGIFPLEETDAGLGIADPANMHFDATAMPSASRSAPPSIRTWRNRSVPSSEPRLARAASAWCSAAAPT